MLKTKLINNELYCDVSLLHNWEANPRRISEKDFKQLREDLARLGQFKPLTVTQDGEILGGNMRFRALLDLGVKEVFIKIVEAETLAQKIDYAFKDNEIRGEYVIEELQALVLHAPELKLEDYSIILARPISLNLLSGEPTVLGKAGETDEADLGGALETYLNNTIKQIVLYFEEAKYNMLIENFEEIRKLNGLDSNTAVVEFLLAQYESHQLGEAKT